MKRVVITGIGVVAPLGIGKEQFWKNAIQGHSYLQADPEMETMGIKSKVLCRVSDFDLADHCSGQEFDHLVEQDRVVQFGVAAGTIAVQDSQLDLKQENPESLGIIFSSAIGGTPTIQKIFEQCSEKGSQPLRHVATGENFYNAGMFNYSAALLARKYDFQGPCTSLSTGCTAGIDALGLSFELIRSGEMQVMLAGATEAPLTSLTYSTLDVIGSLSVTDCEPEKASRPFDAKRGGFVIGEAAAVLVLEELEHALNRGAHIYAEVISYYSVSNAFHMTDLPDHGVPMAAVMEQALHLGKVDPEELDYINAHGSSTPQNDLFETNAYKKVLGDKAYRLPISSTKSMIGHSLSSASLVGVVATLGAIELSMVHPTINYEFPDPDCDLDYVPNVARSTEVGTALLTASGFGGIHSAAILRKYGAPHAE
ncbi:MAG: beta-ketoacyl-[acyl-carrier-protein] synthase family protein [Chroococcidiopsidaceae cyanobacterium CP_BM_RX_35]|nr:beta-ketoacyl-[acyl-carrier-protein] synthase family protein [Chroococcidiopsidaceae cyanobacterium CP_BM_RX_35]